MKRTLFIYLISFWCLLESSYGQESEVLILPGKGIVINSDTLNVGHDKFYSTLNKLDTNENQIFYSFGYGIACGMQQSVDSLSGDTIWKDASWGFHTAQLFYEKNIEIQFYGDSKSSMTIDKIIIEYPAVGYLENGLMIGDYYKSIFNDFDKKDSSYNCAESGPSFCYYNEGVNFRMKKYDEYPFREMRNKIISIEVYEKYK